jgi:Dolichyl-phosphate-mannose-protein mannosyltransferase
VTAPPGPARPSAPGAGQSLRTRVVRTPQDGSRQDRAPEPQAGRSWPSRIISVLGRHWLATLLLAAGLVLRVITQMAYHPALLYIDSVKYLYNAWMGADPIGYKVPIKIIMAVGDLGTVAVVQHLLGLAMAAALYVLLVRRGVNRWLAALAMAPVLFDAYQLQAEATIMPDVVFEALIVAALVVMLWQPAVSWLAAVGAGLILGVAVTVREVGLIMIVPAVLFLLINRGPLFSRGGWFPAFGKSVTLGVGFLLPILACCAVVFHQTGRFELATKGSAAGRMAQVADCATLKLPASARLICPTRAEQARGPDWLQNDPSSPLITNAPKGAARLKVISKLDKAVERQQPQRVVAGVLRDSIRLFEVTRTNTESITPISRWQFQLTYPGYVPEIIVHQDGKIVAGVQYRHGGTWHYFVLNPAFGGKAQVDRPLASFLRSYQLGGGYTPGPLLLVLTIIGFGGSLLALFSRKNTPLGRQMALGSMLFFVSAGGLLLVADVYVYSWRYQLPALITLPMAGVMGGYAFVELFRARKSLKTAAADQASEAEMSGEARPGMC